MTRTAVVIIASSRAAAGVYPDRTGPLIETWLIERGFTVTGPLVRSDGPEVGAALQDAIGADLVITSGGTGISPTDSTPEETAAVLDVQIPGLAAAIRAEGSEKVPTAVLSADSPGWPAILWWSTFRAPPVGSGTAWPCWVGCSTMRWTRSAAVTTGEHRAGGSERGFPSEWSGQ